MAAALVPLEGKSPSHLLLGTEVAGECLIELFVLTGRKRKAIHLCQPRLRKQVGSHSVYSCILFAGERASSANAVLMGYICRTGAT